MYNVMSASCFTNCVTSFNTAGLDDPEAACVESCASRFIKANRRVMELYVVHQQAINMKRMADMQTQSDATVDQDQK